MRHQSATAHELARVGLLAALPGETLARLGERMRREEVRPGDEIDPGERFYVLLAGMLTAGQRVFRPGDHFMDPLRPRAVTPATVASCDRTTYENLVAPLVTG